MPRVAAKPDATFSTSLGFASLRAPLRGACLLSLALSGLLLCAALAGAGAEEAKKPSAPSAPAKPSGPPTWYAQALTRGDAGLNVTHLWSKGASLRAETVVAGHKIVTIVSRDHYYAYDGLVGDGLS